MIIIGYLIQIFNKIGGKSMKRRFFLNQIILSTTATAFTLFSCSTIKLKTATIDVNPDFFITNYWGMNDGVVYFTSELDSELIYLKANPMNKLNITPKRRYDGLDSLKIIETRIMMGENHIYSIEEIIKEK